MISGRGRLLVALVLSWSCALPALALDPRKAITQYVHDVWQTEHGLPQNVVTTICQTRDGYLWLATQEGLVRFDGVRFAVFDRASTPGLVSDQIQTLLEDRRGRLWIGTDNGLSVEENGTIVPFSKEGLLSGTRILAMLEDKRGTLWFGTSSGLRRFSDGKLRTYTKRDGLSNDRVTALVEDGDGTVWVGSSKGIDLWNDRVVRHLGAADGLSSERVVTLYRDRAGTIWVATYGGGLSRVSGGRITRLSVEEGLSSNRSMSILEDREGALWVGSAQGSLDRVFGGTVRSFTARDGLGGVSVFSLVEDREGSLWIGTNGGGLERLRDGKVTPFGAKEGLASDVVFPILEGGDGSVWIGTRSNGVDRLSPDGRVSHFTKAEGLPSDEITSLGLDGTDAVWAGTRAGIARFENGRFAAFTGEDASPLSADFINQIYRARDGALLITVGSKLYRFQEGRFAPYLEKEWPLSAGQTIEDREGNLWIGTYGRGLVRVASGGVTRFGVKEGLSSEHLSAVHEDREGPLWIGTSGAGLNRLAGGRITQIGTKAGLPSDQIASILEDDRGNLWIGTFKGIVRAAKSELDAFADGRARRVSCTLFGVPDGMRSPDCNRDLLPSAWRARDGRLWFPTSRGAVVVDPGHLPMNTQPPPVVLEAAVVDESPVSRAGDVVLPPGRKRFEFRYTALSFLAPQRVRFRYRLEGYDRDWLDAGGERVARYTNLPPRRYTFRVRASNDDGVWNEAGASFSFRLRPHFYETWWFSSLCVLAIAAAGAGAQRVRVRRLKARERELVSAVAESTRALREAQDKISRMLEAGPAVSESVRAWSRSIAQEVAAATGARAIGVWEVERDSLVPLSDSGVSPPSTAELQALVPAAGESFVPWGESTLVPVTGMSGELCGVLLVSGGDPAWGETERHLVAAFARQLGGALEMKRMRQRLAAAEERRLATRREMRERGIATLQTCPACGRCYDDKAASCEADGAVLESPRPLPYVLLDRYRFLRVLGKGGMGLVLLAKDERLGREVAIKLIRPDHFEDPELRRRFAREAQALARIQHPGVIALHDSGELPDATMFLVMEKLAGRDLGNVLKIHGRGSPRQVAALVRQGSSALRAAHRSGIVHRDIKPENVFLVGESGGFRVKLLDFGVAKPLGGEGKVTRTGVVIGTPQYMPPEQVHGEDVDTRADVYSFAAVCYEALAGRPAIQGTDLGRVLVNVVHVEPPRLSTLLAGVPEIADEAFVSALAKDRERRPPDIEVWASSLADALESLPEDPRVPGWPVGESTFWEPRREASAAREGPTRRRLSKLDPERWQAVSPYLDRALSLDGADCAALISSLRERDPALAADLEALLDADRTLEREGFLQQSPAVPPPPAKG